MFQNVGVLGASEGKLQFAVRRLYLKVVCLVSNLIASSLAPDSQLPGRTVRGRLILPVRLKRLTGHHV